MADERDLVAAEKNNQPNQKRDGRSATFTDAFDAPDQQGRVGPNAENQYRAAPGEGSRAPFSQETGDDPQFSVYDGKGNESVVVLTEDEQGRAAQGTGPDTASARKEARKGKAHPGSAFGE